MPSRLHRPFLFSGFCRNQLASCTGVVTCKPMNLVASSHESTTGRLGDGKDIQEGIHLKSGIRDNRTRGKVAEFLKEKAIIKDKVTAKHTTNNWGEANRKIIVFCAFADTAAYLYEQLEPWASGTLRSHIALVSGGARPNRATFGAAEFNQIPTNFAPRAKQRAKMSRMPQDGEIFSPKTCTQKTSACSMPAPQRASRAAWTRRPKPPKSSTPATPSTDSCSSCKRWRWCD